MNDIPNTWQNRNYDLQGLADFFNDYKISFFGFDSSETTKKVYIKQIMEMHEYVLPCLHSLMNEGFEKKYKDKGPSDDVAIKIVKDILNNLVEKNLVTQKKIQQIKDNLVDIYKDPAFQDTERVELETYKELRIKKVIMTLNLERIDLKTEELI